MQDRVTGVNPDPVVQARVVEHLHLVRYAVHVVVSRVRVPAHVSREDLESCAQVALVETAGRYDPAAGASFATYVLPRLQGAVLDELRAADWAPRTVRAKARQVQAASDALTGQLGRGPTRAEVAAELGWTEGQIGAVAHDVHRALVLSVEAEESPLRLAGGQTPEAALLGREQVAYLLGALQALPDHLGEVIERNFFGEESLTDIAADLGVTLSRVSQMRSEALRLLGMALRSSLDGVDQTGSVGARARARVVAYLGQAAHRGAGLSRGTGLAAAARAPMAVAAVV